MKKVWCVLGLSALLTLPLTGCGGNRTGSQTLTASPSPAVQSPLPGSGEDLAGSDGVVGNDNTANGRANNSPLERVGEGVKDTLDDMGNAARNVARDAERAITH